MSETPEYMQELMDLRQKLDNISVKEAERILYSKLHKLTSDYLKNNRPNIENEIIEQITTYYDKSRSFKQKCLRITITLPEFIQHQFTQLINDTLAYDFHYDTLTDEQFSHGFCSPDFQAHLKEIFETERIDILLTRTLMNTTDYEINPQFESHLVFILSSDLIYCEANVETNAESNETNKTNEISNPTIESPLIKKLLEMRNVIRISSLAEISDPITAINPIKAIKPSPIRDNSAEEETFSLWSDSDEEEKNKEKIADADPTTHFLEQIKSCRRHFIREIRNEFLRYSTASNYNPDQPIRISLQFLFDWSWGTEKKLILDENFQARFNQILGTQDFSITRHPHELCITFIPANLARRGTLNQPILNYSQSKLQKYLLELENRIIKIRKNLLTTLTNDRSYIITRCRELLKANWQFAEHRTYTLYSFEIKGIDYTVNDTDYTYIMTPDFKNEINEAIGLTDFDYTMHYNPTELGLKARAELEDRQTNEGFALTGPYIRMHLPSYLLKTS